MTIKRLVIIAVATFTGFGIALTRDELERRAQFVSLCHREAGTYLLDEGTGEITQRVSLQCGSTDGRRKLCREAGPITDLSYEKSPTIFGIMEKSYPENDGVSIDYRVFHLGGRKYLAYRNYWGPEPGWRGIIGDLIPIGEKSSVDCFSI